MKQLLLFAGLTLGVTQLASAAPMCVGGSLASFIALGSGGCMIGTNTLSGFQALPGIGGATAISPNNVTITPIGGTTNPGLTAMTNLTATNGQIFDALITYMLTGNLYTSDSISISNATSSGNGAVSDIQNFCLGGTFGPNGVSGCTSGNAGSLLALGNPGVNTNQTNLTPIGKLTITHNFTLDGGGNGSASGATITDQFAATASIPEPATYLLAGLGLALAAFSKLRSSKFGSSRS